MARDPFEDTIEVSEGLEADLEGNFTDPQISIEQEVLGFFNARAREIICKINPGELFEYFAEVKAACVHSLCHLA